MAGSTGLTDRQNIKSSVLSGESADVCEEDVQDFVKRIKEICKGYLPKDIFNCDESGLIFRLLPKMSLVQKGYSCDGGKLAKERITFLCCANILGEKLPLLVIGKSQNPQCFNDRPIL